MRLRPVSLPASGEPLSAALRETAGLVLLALLCLLSTSWLVPTDARAEACPGASFCPYASVKQIGQRAEGVLRFPEAVAIGPAGDVYVADQLSYIVQKSSAPRARSRTSGAPSAAGTGSSVRSAGSPSTRPATSTWSTRATTGSRSSPPTGTFIRAWGQQGSELGQFSFGSSQDSTKPPGGGIAVTGSYVYVADSGNNRIERFNLQGGEAMAWGTKGSEPGQFRYPRGVAANGARCSSPTTTTTASRSSTPKAPTSAGAGTAGHGPRAVRLPLRRRARRGRQRLRRRRPQPPRRQAEPSARLPRRVGRLRHQTRPARVPARDRQRPGRRHLRRQHRQRPHRGVRPERQLPAHDRHLRARARGADRRRAGSRSIRPGGCSCPTRSASRVELFAPASDAFAGQWTAMPGRDARS